MAFMDTLTGAGGIGAETVIKYVGGALAIAIGKSAIKRVPTGGMGVKTRFDKVREHRDGASRIVNSGGQLIIPLVDSLEIVDIRKRPDDLPPIPLDLMRNGILMKHTIRASIRWSVSPESEAPVVSHFENTGLTQALTNRYASAVHDYCKGKEYTEASDSKAVYDGVQAEISDELLHDYGVVVHGLYITEAARTGEEILAAAIRESGGTDPGVLAAIIRELSERSPGPDVDPEGFDP